jgi:sugar/nucleoside kinase (ribokinase family)
MGKVGDDAFGRILHDMLGSAGLLVEPGGQTSYSVVLAAQGMDRIFLHCAGANDTFSADDVPAAEAGRARVFHFGYPPLMRSTYEDGGRGLARLFQAVRDAGATTSLDMAWPDAGSPAGDVDWRAFLERVLPHTGIFLPSLDEALVMLRPAEYERLQAAAGDGGVAALVTPELLSALTREMLVLGPAIAGLKLGWRGFFVRTGGRAALANLGRGAPAQPEAWAGRELWAPAFQVQEVTATGAGDVAIAGFLCGLLKGLRAEESLLMACAAGASSLEAVDATGGLPSWDAVRERVARGWARHPLELQGEGWQRHGATGMWRRMTG